MYPMDDHILMPCPVNGRGYGDHPAFLGISMEHKVKTLQVGG